LIGISNKHITFEVFSDVNYTSGYRGPNAPTVM